MAARSSPAARRSIAKHRRAFHEYHVLERLEAGIALMGTEVKSLRAGHLTLTGSHVRVQDGEAWLIGCQIPEYRYGNRMNHEPLRKRKLLLHAREIRRLEQGVRQEGLTIVPLEVYFQGPRVKVEIALVRGKKLADKRESMAKKDAQRDVERALRRRR